MHQENSQEICSTITSQASFRLHMSVQGLFSLPQNADITKRMWIRCLLISTLVSNVTYASLGEDS